MSGWRQSAAPVCAAPGELVKQDVWVFETMTKVTHDVGVHSGIVITVGREPFGVGLHGGGRLEVRAPERSCCFEGGGECVMHEVVEVAIARLLHKEWWSMHIIRFTAVRLAMHSAEVLVTGV